MSYDNYEFINANISPIENKYDIYGSYMLYDKINSYMVTSMRENIKYMALFVKVGTVKSVLQKINYERSLLLCYFPTVHDPADNNLLRYREPVNI